MGRFSAARVIVRKLEDADIIFWDRRTIHLECNGSRFVFHRWYAPNGEYQEWRRFRQLLLTRKRITFRDVFELANAHDIFFQSAVGNLKWNKKPVEVRFGNIKIIGVSNDM